MLSGCSRNGCPDAAEIRTHGKQFQSTHPRRVRRSRFRKNEYHLSTFQSTHPRRVRQEKRRKGHNELISIHAPTQGATLPRMGKCWHGPISIHAPTQGATAKMNKNPFVSWDFWSYFAFFVINYLTPIIYFAFHKGFLL